MKNIFQFTFALLFSVALVSSAFAQQVPDSELKKDEADKLIQELKISVDGLRAKLQSSEKEIADLRAQVDARGKDVTKCQDELFALLGATRADYMAYREAVARAEAKMRELSSLSDAQLAERKGEIDALAADIAALKANKLAMLPEFYDRIIKLDSDLMALRARKLHGKEYVVGTWARDRDCLWNIAKKPDIYSDAYAWPKIWTANKDQVRNPDLIYPKQVLQIP